MNWRRMRTDGRKRERRGIEGDRDRGGRCRNGEMLEDDGEWRNAVDGWG